MLNKLLIKCLMLLPPEWSHQLVLFSLHYWGKCLGPKEQMGQAQELFGLSFPNRLGLAAGFDKDGFAIDGLSRLGFGFIEIGTLTPRPQAGHKKPRLFRLFKEKSLINRMGFNNCGIDTAIKHIKASRYRGILGINIGKNADTPMAQAADDYKLAMKKIYPYASYITINISSPNTENLRQLQQGEVLHALLTDLKKLQAELATETKRYVPLLVKLSPDLLATDIQDIAKTLLETHIDGVIATNTSLSRIGVEQSPHAKEAGGLSGEKITDLSTNIIKQLSIALQGKIPIIASGGIMSAKDAKEKLQAGASLVQIYTGFIYKGSALIKEILESTV